MKTTKLIAHRGLHKGREIPENSMLAFQKAVEKNFQNNNVDVEKLYQMIRKLSD